MSKKPEPVVLELASLMREQIGPFLLLGLDKAADHDACERHWADRVRWARRDTIKVALEDVNWARDALSTPEKRVKADAASLNSDTSDGYLGGLSHRFGLAGGQVTRAWQPLDAEKPLAEYSPTADKPDMQATRDSINVPEAPEEAPAVGALLAQLVAKPFDPWSLELPA
jgi:hypothetical protein